MKHLFKVLFRGVIIIWIGFSCKEPKPQAAGNEIPADNCKVATFTEFERTYSLEYDSNGLPVKVFRVVGGFDPILYRKLEYQGGKLTTVHGVTLEGVSFPKTKFEYKGDHLRLIRIFDGYRQNVADTAFEIKEIERIEFGYTLSDKPASLIRWLPDGKGGFAETQKSELEYNAAGNLVVERTHVSATQTASEADFVFEYFYDDKPNTQKQLNYLFFTIADSPARLFSANNLNRLTIAEGKVTFRDEVLKLVYSSKGNVVSDGSRFTDMTWICE